jgi:hypothetical protein
MLVTDYSYGIIYETVLLPRISLETLPPGLRSSNGPDRVVSSTTGRSS